MAIVTKDAAAEKSHMGFSEIYGVRGGFEVTDGAVDLSAIEKIMNYPVEDGSFNYNGGTPSANNFRIYGQSTPWDSTFTPGDSSVAFNVPTYEDGVLESFGFKLTDLEVKGAGDITGDEKKTSLKGKAFPQLQKSFHLGIIGVADDGESAVFIKDVKVTATVMMDDNAKPLYIAINGVISKGNDKYSMAILEPSAPATAGR